MIKLNREHGQNHADNIIDTVLDFNTALSWTVTSGTGTGAHSDLEAFQGAMSLKISNNSPTNDLTIGHSAQSTIIPRSGKYQLSTRVRKNIVGELITLSVKIYEDAVIKDTQEIEIGSRDLDKDVAGQWVTYIADTEYDFAKDVDVTFAFTLRGIADTALGATELFVDGLMLNESERGNIIPPRYVKPV